MNADAHLTNLVLAPEPVVRCARQQSDVFLLRWYVDYAERGVVALTASDVMSQPLGLRASGER